MVSFYARHVLLAMALPAGEHVLDLLLIRVLMIPAVIVLTEAVYARLPRELGVVHQTRRAL